MSGFRNSFQDYILFSEQFYESYAKMGSDIRKSIKATPIHRFWGGKSNRAVNRFNTKQIFWWSDKKSQNIFDADEAIQLALNWSDTIGRYKNRNSTPKSVHKKGPIQSELEIDDWICQFNREIKSGIGRSFNRTFCPPFLSNPPNRYLKRADTIARYKNRNLQSTDCIGRYNGRSINRTSHTFDLRRLSKSWNKLPDEVSGEISDLFIVIKASRNLEFFPLQKSSQ
jgi:hypothetical protein